MIRIKKLNDSFIYVDCEPSIAYELHEKFSFYVPGYKYQPKYKLGIWDGKIKLFHPKEKQLQAGLLTDLIKWLKEEGLPFEIDKESFAHVNFKEALENITDHVAAYTKFTPYDYQLAYLRKSLMMNRALVLSPTGSGKSHTIYLTVRTILEKLPGKVLIVVPVTNLCSQMATDFAEYDPTGYIEAETHIIMAGREKVSDKRVFISTYQSIYKLPANSPFWDQFDAVLIDEAHLADSASLTGIVQKCVNCPVKIGYTGTLDGSKCHEMAMRGLFGPLLNEVDTATLQDAGILSKLEIRILKLSYTKKDRKVIGQCNDYKAEVDWLIKNKARNKIIIDEALKFDGNVVVMFQYVEKHAKVIYDELQEYVKSHGKELYLVYGGIDVDERERIRARAEVQSNLIIIASYATMSTGVNIKNLAGVIFAHSLKKQIKVLQSIGRILRTHSSKAVAILVDIVDDLSPSKSKPNFGMKHSLERMKVYVTQGFKYKIETVTMPETFDE
jgi:superfamily II DNA or RNA helicase